MLWNEQKRSNAKKKGMQNIISRDRQKKNKLNARVKNYLKKQIPRFKDWTKRQHNKNRE